MDDLAKVEHCRFAFECTQRWGDLARVSGHPFVRYCAACETPVDYVTSAKAFDEHAAKGHCVALGRRKPPSPGPGREPRPRDVEITLGIPTKPWGSE